MIPIKKSINNKPTSLTSTSCTNNLNKKVWNKGNVDTSKISGHYYRAKDVKTKLANLYHNKCAYCETFDDEFDIEHYRPKAGVKGDKSHPGYYWLCYEWTNLLPACHDCNKTRNKGNHFPTKGKKVDRPKFTGSPKSIDLKANHFKSNRLTNEIPLLLHPEDPNFNPFYYFKFNEKGWMSAKHPKGSLAYEKAHTTIKKVVKLNRPKLYLDRKKTLESLKKRLYVHLEKFGADKITEETFKEYYFDILELIKNNGRPDKPHSFFWDYLYKNISIIISSYFNSNARFALLYFTEEFKKINP